MGNTIIKLNGEIVFTRETYVDIHDNRGDGVHLIPLRYVYFPNPNLGADGSIATNNIEPDRFVYLTIETNEDDPYCGKNYTFEVDTVQEVAFIASEFGEALRY